MNRGCPGGGIKRGCGFDGIGAEPSILSVVDVGTGTLLGIPGIAGIPMKAMCEYRLPPWRVVEGCAASIECAGSTATTWSMPAAACCQRSGGIVSVAAAKAHGMVVP